MRKLAPSGTPISQRDLFLWARSLFSRQTTLNRLAAEISQSFEIDQCFFFSTGRAAMVVLLESLTEMAPTTKSVVVIPSYTCYSVPSSIIKAGLQINVCDIDEKTLDYDYDKLEQMDFSRVLAVVSSNLYGIPNDLDRLERLSEEKDLFLLDDAAQSMGALSQAKRPAGTYGIAGLYSLDKGKVITSINGGIIVTRSSKLGAILQRRTRQIPPAPIPWCLVEVLKMAVYSGFLSPRRYWIPAALPFVKLGITEYTTDYPVSGYNSMLAGIALSLFRQLEAINNKSIAKAVYYQENLPSSEHLHLIQPPPMSKPIYLRYPLRITDNMRRRTILALLEKSGLGASGSYPGAIVDIYQLRDRLEIDGRDFRGGRMIAEQIVTLPTHALVEKMDQDRILNCIAKVLR